MKWIAIVGPCIIASEHISDVSKLPDCELGALCDLNGKKAKTLSEQLNVPCFLEVGKHVLVERPMLIPLRNVT